MSTKLSYEEDLVLGWVHLICLAAFILTAGNATSENDPLPSMPSSRSKQGRRTTAMPSSVDPMLPTPAKLPFSDPQCVRA